jgi:dehydrogenase/reductase SDR family protein 7B
MRRHCHPGSFAQRFAPVGAGGRASAETGDAMTFQGKTVWTTGASSGIGEALAKGLAARGASVILSGRRASELQRVAGAIGGETLILPFEATDYDALPEIVERAWAWRGGVDLLINNAGISQRSLARDTDIAIYRRLMEVDFFAPLRLTQLVVSRMIASRSGHIAIVSSVAGKVGAPLRTGYCAAKHACLGYFDALRTEVETAYGIDVSVILPGSVRTSISVNALNADGSAYGRTDANIESGMPVDKAAGIILEGLSARRREIPVAEGREFGALQARSQDPETLFRVLAQEGARLAALREEQGPNFSPEPAKINASS